MSYPAGGPISSVCPGSKGSALFVRVFGQILIGTWMPA